MEVTITMNVSDFVLSSAVRGEDSLHYRTVLFSNLTLPPGFDDTQPSTDELSRMKQSQHNPNTNTSLNNSKLLRLCLLVFYQIFLLLGRSLGSTARSWRILICFFFFFPHPILQPGSNKRQYPGISPSIV